MAAAWLEGSSPTSPPRHLTDAGAPPEIAGDLVDPFLLPPSTRLSPHYSYPMEATVPVHLSQPSEVFIFKCCLSWDSGFNFKRKK